MMRPGFSLIEILVALTISSFVMQMVFTTISLLQKSARRYNELIASDSQQEMLFGQLQKDISGMVIPIYGFVASSKDKPEEQQKKQEQYNAQYGLQIEIENERLKSLSFVTTSVLGSYGVFKPRLARVRYLLTPEENSSYFKLLRQESAELSLADFEKDNDKNKNFSHTIALGIKTCAINCTLIMQQDGKKKIEEVSSWSFAEQMKKQQKESPQKEGSERIEKKIELPSIISLKGSFVDETSKHEYPFNYSFFVPIDTRTNKKTEAKAPAPAQPASTQATAGQAQSGATQAPVMPKLTLPIGVKP